MLSVVCLDTDVNHRVSVEIVLIGLRSKATRMLSPELLPYQRWPDLQHCPTVEQLKTGLQMKTLERLWQSSEKVKSSQLVVFSNELKE